jgi:hypothetical protein
LVGSPESDRIDRRRYLRPAATGLPIPVLVVVRVTIVARFRGFAATAPPGWVGARPATSLSPVPLPGAIRVVVRVLNVSGEGFEPTLSAL